MGADSLEDPWIPGDGHNAGQGKSEKPEDHDGSEGGGNPVRALGLEDEQYYRYQCGDPDDGSLMETFHARNQKHTLNCGQNTDGRGDDSVSQEEGNSQEGKKADESHLPSRFHESGEDFLEDDGSSLTLAAKAHGEPGILNGNENGQGPDDKRQDPEHVVGGRPGEGEDDCQGINGACADVPENETKGLGDAFQT